LCSLREIFLIFFFENFYQEDQRSIHSMSSFFTCQICVLLVNLYNHCPKGIIIVSCTPIKFAL
jgi:hypothetical protein